MLFALVQQFSYSQTLHEAILGPTSQRWPTLTCNDDILSEPYALDGFLVFLEMFLLVCDMFVFDLSPWCLWILAFVILATFPLQRPQRSIT